MPHVFISYVRENGDLVDRLASELKGRGVTVWLDRNDIEPGTRWRDAIKNAIRGGKFFIACFSRESNEREKSYMNEELTLAIDELRERPSNKTWFIPILINEATIPSRSISRVEDLSDIQAVKLYENWSDGVRRILDVIKHDDPISTRINFLVNILRYPFHGERLYALQQLVDALHDIGPAAADAVPTLAEALNDQNANVRLRAVDALQRIGPAAVPTLAEALNDQNADVRLRAVDALQEIGPAAANAVLALAKALQDQDPDVHSRAVNAFQRIGPAAADAVPALVEALNDQHPGINGIHLGVISALCRIGPAAVPALVEALNDQDPGFRSRATHALCGIGPAAADAVPALAEALNDQDPGTRSLAAYALQRIGPAAVPALAEALKDQNADIRRFAAAALESLRQKS